ncbi:hypothetical protein [Halobiforma nitratireducens]|uniref:Uncharacterized protein n=1 Tax=Halobiforma nitratireducens JCM 10879 TaxID=1227454 RepID=M0M8J3_9EURY|nr:hypothetical protein [Halobiforma nitratireducens]EMA41673.1 hypothetical protein C446_05140 [Halobiforma nitratireducens JCM 10879]
MYEAFQLFLSEVESAITRAERHPVVDRRSTDEYLVADIDGPGLVAEFGTSSTRSDLHLEERDS